MKQTTIWAGVLACFWGLAELSASPADEQQMAAANNGFAFKLLQQLAKDEPATNIFISPYIGIHFRSAAVSEGPAADAYIARKTIE